MIKKYEDACREALRNNEITEEQVSEIRRLFDAQKKKLKRENRAIERLEIEYFSINGAVVTLEGNRDYEIPDENADVEETAIHHIELEMLRSAMKELPSEERDFLIACYEVRNDSLLARKLGADRRRLRDRRLALEEKLRKMMLG